jgi:hypothetical protein
VTNAKNETFRRLGAPACASCGSVGARQRIVKIQNSLNYGEGEDWLGASNRIESEHYMLLCSGSCARDIVGRKIYIVDAKLRPEPGPDQKPLGVILGVNPLPQNHLAIGVEMPVK